MGPAPPAGGWADRPRDLLEAVARAVPAGDRLWFRLVCRRWAAAGAAVAQAVGGEQLPPGMVTRTCGADMAASVARAKMVLGVLKGSHILAKVSEPEGDIKVTAKMFTRILCSFSASGGHVAVLKWAQANGYPCDETTCTRTAEKKHLEVFQWARA